jgi:hypothetical protein
VVVTAVVAAVVAADVADCVDVTEALGDVVAGEESDELQAVKKKVEMTMATRTISRFLFTVSSFFI